MGGILDYIPGGSLLHCINPLVKLIIAFCLCVSCFLTANPLVVLCIILLTLAAAASAGVLRRELKILGGLAKFAALLFCIQVLFINAGDVMVALPFGIKITNDGVLFSLLFALRLLAMTLPLTLMLSVTQMSELASALVTAGLGYRYAFAFTTAVRFVPLFADEMHSIMEAQTSRGVEFDTRNIIKKIALLLPLCVPLVVSAVARADSGAMSAELRGFHLRTRKSGRHSNRLSYLDVIGLVCAFAIISATVLL